MIKLTIYYDLFNFNFHILVKIQVIYTPDFRQTKEYFSKAELLFQLLS